MRTRFPLTFTVALFAGLIASCGLTAAQEPVSAVGQKVLVLRDDVSAELAKGVGQTTTLRGIAYTVLEVDKAGRYLLRDRSKDVWVNSADTVFAREAVKHFSDRLAASPNSADLLTRRAVAKLATADYDAALADATAAIAADAKRAAAYSVRANALAHGKRDHAKAIADYSKAVELDATDSQPLLGRGLARLELSQFAEAIPDLFAASQMDPSDRAALAALDYCFRRKYPDDEAVRAATDKIREQPTADAFLARAALWDARNELLAAQIDLDRAVTLSPEAAPVLTARARLFLRRQLPERSIADCTAALRVEPNRVEALVLRGTAHQMQGKVGPAQQDFEKAVAIAPSDPAVRVARGRLSLQQKDYATAVAEFTQALETRPKDLDAVTGRAAALQADGKAAEAVADWVVMISDARVAQKVREDAFAAATRAAPKDHRPYVARAKQRFAEKAPNFTQILADLDQAVQLNPNDLDARLLRGQSRMQLGQVDIAIGEFGGILMKKANSVDAEVALSRAVQQRFKDSPKLWVSPKAKWPGDFIPEKERVQRASAFFTAKLPTLAWVELTRAIEEGNDTSTTHLLRGKAAEMCSEYELAMADYRKSVANEHKSGLGDAAWAARLAQGELLLKKREYPAAARHYAELVRSEPIASRFPSNLRQFLLEVGDEKGKGSIDDLRRGVDEFREAQERTEPERLLFTAMTRGMIIALAPEREWGDAADGMWLRSPASGFEWALRRQHAENPRLVAITEKLDRKPDSSDEWVEFGKLLSELKEQDGATYAFIQAIRTGQGPAEAFAELERTLKAKYQAGSLVKTTADVVALCERKKEFDAAIALTTGGNFKKDVEQLGYDPTKDLLAKFAGTRPSPISLFLQRDKFRMRPLSLGPSAGNDQVIAKAPIGFLFLVNDELHLANEVLKAGKVAIESYVGVPPFAAPYTAEMKQRDRDEVASNNPLVYMGCSLLSSAQGQHQRAVQEAKYQSERSEKLAVARAVLAHAHYRGGDVKEAIKTYEECLKMDPSSTAARCGLAWVLATAKDSKVADAKRAKELATKAKATGFNNSPEVLTVLAAAHAADGEFEKAVGYQKEALSLPVESERFHAQMAALLRRYEARKSAR